MAFILLLILTTLSIAGSAAFFSIYGLAQIFTGSFWPVVVMASSLEAGKLVAASYVYRYWNSIGWILRTYYITAIFVLMLITSAGIFGFLSSAYQQDVANIKSNEQQIVLLQEENEQIESWRRERLNRKDQIDSDIASLPNNYITARQRLVETFGPELEQLKADISEYTDDIRENSKEIARLKAENLEREVHVGPIIFIARVFNKNIDDTTKWLILIIIFAFDPLAVALTVGANVALIHHKQSKMDKVEINSDGDPLPFPFPSQSTSIGAGEPNPTVTKVEQILEQPREEITPEQVHAALKELMQYERELTPAELQQKETLQEILAKKNVTRRIREGRSGAKTDNP